MMESRGITETMIEEVVVASLDGVGRASEKSARESWVDSSSGRSCRDRSMYELGHPRSTQSCLMRSEP
jgi:hypothetical protein